MPIKANKVKIFGRLKGENDMRKNKKLLVASAILISCAIASWFAASTRGQAKVYEVHPQVAYPYGYTNITDNSRLIDLIEHLSYQNQQLAQNQAAGTAVIFTINTVFLQFFDNEQQLFADKRLWSKK